MGEPDPFKFRYSSQIKELVRNIVMELVAPKEITNFIETWTRGHIPEADQNHFSTTIETEVMNLYEGNIARYQISNAAYQRWKKIDEK